MSKKVLLEHIHDLLIPGHKGHNLNNGTDYDLIHDKNNDRLILSDGRVYVDNKTCRTYEDQKAQFNKLHKERFNDLS